MTIDQIKATVGIATLMLVRQLEQIPEGAPADYKPVATQWVSHWDNDKRIRVTMHEDILVALKADPRKADLAIKKQEVLATAEREAYTRYVVIVPQNVEAVF